jgi:DNA-binding NarL/FixJ family response regulator
MAKQGVSPISVLIVDESAPFQIALRELVCATGFEVTGEAESGEARLSLVQQLHPSWFLWMSRCLGLEESRLLLDLLPEPATGFREHAVVGGGLV